MVKQEIHYFAGTFGSVGYTSYLDSNFSPLKRTVRLSGYPGQAAEQLVEHVRKEAARRGMSCEIIHNFLDGRPEGIIIPECGAGLINVPLYLLGEENLLGILEDEHIMQTKNALSDAESCFRQAKKIHDGWEKIYIANMDFGAADSLADETCRRVLDGRKGTETGRIADRFLGAATSEGSVDKIEQITKELMKRYFIKGRPGTGKSTFLRKVVRAASNAGFDVEQYHCSFDPGSLDMAVIRGLGVCLFDSTAPHEYFPSRASDEIIDIYETAVTPGTDEKYEKELAAFSAEYKFKVLEAGKALRRARSAYEKTEAYYMAKINWVEFEQAAENYRGILLEQQDEISS